jgi:hypothetical protein
MQVNCPNCGRIIQFDEPPQRYPVKDNEWWLCLWCDTVMCVYCYMEHTKIHSGKDKHEPHR